MMSSAVVISSCADLRERAVRRVDKEVHLHSMSVRTKKEKRDVVSTGHPRPVERDVDARERPAVSASVRVGDYCDRDTLA
jgi:hypothetical protein